ncbi:MAG TPA: glycosyltransferase family A protein [Blastocatellia bacterium]|nr:glycosyltransferase family A protein [Blastocatellia bacterium]
MTQMKTPEKAITHDKGGPDVSIIIPVYQCARYLVSALDSVYAQTFTNFEVIVVNDGSDDAEEIERCLVGRPRLIYIKQKNGGPSAARNAGLLVASGRFVAFLDADDYWEPNHLAEQVAFINRDPGIDLAYADASLVNGSHLADRTFMEEIPSSGEVTFEGLLDERCTVLLSSVVARRQSVMAVGMFDESLRYAEDYDLWLRLAKRGSRLAYQRKVLLNKRRHSESLTADSKKLFESALDVLDKVGRGELTDSERAAVTRQKKKLLACMKLESGKLNLARGQFTAAVEAFKEANEFYRSWKLRWVLFWLRFSPHLLCRVYNRYRPMALEPREK